MSEIFSNTYSEIVTIINNARERAYRKVNEELILMYRDIGKYISEHAENATYGDSFVDGLADFFAKNYPDLKGFNRRGLYRMKQFYELYKDDQKVSPLVTQLSWTHHLIIMSACKSAEERLFYMTLCIRERYSKRELQRQIDSGYYERAMYSSILTRLISSTCPKVFPSATFLRLSSITSKISFWKSAKILRSLIRNIACRSATTTIS